MPLIGQSPRLRSRRWSQNGHWSIYGSPKTGTGWPKCPLWVWALELSFHWKNGAAIPCDSKSWRDELQRGDWCLCPNRGCDAPAPQTAGFREGSVRSQDLGCLVKSGLCVLVWCCFKQICASLGRAPLMQSLTSEVLRIGLTKWRQPAAQKKATFTFFSQSHHRFKAGTNPNVVSLGHRRVWSDLNADMLRPHLRTCEMRTYVGQLRRSNHRI